MDQAALALTHLQHHYPISVLRVFRYRCGECPACITPDCDRCPCCKDKEINGGPGKKHKPCEARRNCLNPKLKQHKSSCLTGKSDKKHNAEQAPDQDTISPPKQNNGPYYCFWCTRGPFSEKGSLRRHCRKKHSKDLHQADREGVAYWTS